jgi:hypothetical protein
MQDDKVWCNDNGVEKKMEDVFREGWHWGKVGFVHPETNQLIILKEKKSRKWRTKKFPKNTHRVHNTFMVKKIHGIWYGLTMTDLPEEPHEILKSWYGLYATDYYLICDPCIALYHKCDDGRQGRQYPFVYRTRKVTANDLTKYYGLGNKQYCSEMKQLNSREIKKYLPWLEKGK